MIKALEKLEKKLGSANEAARALGISDRHYRRIKKEKNTTKTIELLIEKLLHPDEQAA
jgi:DNA invertase Pin-like site-specific DNA recombinase